MLAKNVVDARDKVFKKRIAKPCGVEIVQGNEESRIIKNLNIGTGVCLVKLDRNDVE